MWPVDWSGEDVFIIGGGRSLERFDFRQLILHRTIGCNQAFLLGSAVCDICVFGDDKFFGAFEKELTSFKGHLVTNHPEVIGPERLIHYRRVECEGLINEDGALAWNGNTGCLAVNLALALGARRVFLLGFDMRISDPIRNHWHDRAIETPTSAHYERFKNQFAAVAATRYLYPEAKIFNVHDHTSDLACFPNLTFATLGFKGPNNRGVRQCEHQLLSS